MLRRHAVSIGLAALAIVLAAYLLFVDSARVTSAEKDSRKRNLLPAYRRADISELVIENHGETVRIGQRGDDSGTSMFYLADGELADQTSVDKVLASLEFATPERRLEPGFDRGVMGLEAPRLRVKLTMGALVYRIVIGGAAPVPAGAAYATVEGEGFTGEQLCVVARDLVTELSRDGDFYRSRTLIPYLSSSLSRISLEGQAGSRELLRGKWGGWGIVIAGQTIRADREPMDRLLASFADLTAEAFTSEDQAKKALGAAGDKLRLVLVPTDAAAPRAVLSIGGECPDHAEDVVALRSEPLPVKAACVPRGVMDPLSMGASSLADLHLFSLRADEMESIEMTTGDKKLELVRAGTGWHMRFPTDGKVDSEVAQALASSLHELSAEAFADADDRQHFAPIGKATVTRVGEGTAPDGGAFDSSRLEQVEMGNEANGAAYVRRLIDDVVLRVSPDVARQLSPNGPSLRSRKIIDVPIGRVRKVVVAAGEVQQTLSRSSAGGWTFDEPKSLAIDPGLAGDIAEALAELRADRWAADADDGSFGFESPRARYQLVLDRETIRVEVGRKTGRGSWARRADQPGIFVLPQATEQKIETWAVDRSYFMIEAGEIRAIKIERGAEAAALSPTGDPERFEVAKRILSEARAEGMVHLGAPRPEEGFDRSALVVSVTRSSVPGATSTLRMTVGRGDVFHDTNVFYARRADVAATFAIAQGKLRALLEMDLSPASPRPGAAPPPTLSHSAR